MGKFSDSAISLFTRKKMRRHQPPGTVPGTLTARHDALPTEIQVYAFGPDVCHEVKVTDHANIAQVAEVRERAAVCWVDVTGVGTVSVIKELGELFGLHPLALEDVLTLGQRAKVEEYDDHLFIVVPMLRRRDSFETEQLSMFVGERFVITFQEEPGDCFGAIRDRIRLARGRVRGRDADYLAYALLDSIVDDYFPGVDAIEHELEKVEDIIFSSQEPHILKRLHGLKRQLHELRWTLRPLQNVMDVLLNPSTPMIGDETRVFLRDCRDHVVRILDQLESDRIWASDLMDFQLSGMNNRMNEVMKVLTVVTAIFIPLSFIAGVYGMNFDTSVSKFNMPELHWKYGYPLALLLMLVVAMGMVAYFRRKKWL